MGATDIIVDYYHATQVDLPAMAGQFGTTYAIPIIYVPLLMITHVVAFYWLVASSTGQQIVDNDAADPLKTGEPI